jgi:hypothetical protein
MDGRKNSGAPERELATNIKREKRCWVRGEGALGNLTPSKNWKKKKKKSYQRRKASHRRLISTTTSTTTTTAPLVALKT